MAQLFKEVAAEEKAQQQQVAEAIKKDMHASLPTGVQGPVQPLEKRWEIEEKKARDTARNNYIYGKADLSKFTYQTTAEYDAEIAKLESQYATIETPVRVVNSSSPSARVLRNRKTDEQKEIQSKIDALKAERTLLEREIRFDTKYAPLMNNPDFAVNSVERTPQVDYPNESREYIQNTLVNLGNTEPKDQDEKLYEYYKKYGTIINDAYLEGRVRKGYNHMTDEERAVYNYLYNTAGYQKASQYLSDMEVILARRRARAKEFDETEEYNQSSDWGKFGKNVETLVTSPIGAVASALDDLGQALSVSGKEYNPYTWSHDLTAYTDTIIGAYSQDVYQNTYEATGNKTLAQLAATGYQSGMSAAQAIVGTFALGPTGYLVVSGANAATHKAKELYESGAEGYQIAFGSVASGVIEAVAEKIPLDELWKMTGGTKGVRQIVYNVIRQMGLEGTEEGLTEIGNTIADCIIQGGNSDLSRQIAAYENEGYDPAQAKQMAFRDKAVDVAWSYAGGMMAGGPSAAVFSTVGSVRDYQQTKSVGNAILADGQQLQAAITAGLHTAPNTDAHKIAVAVQTKLASGDGNKISAYQVGEMVRDTMTPETRKATALYTSVRQSAQALGVDDATAEEIGTIAAATGRQVEFVRPEDLQIVGPNGVSIPEGRYTSDGRVQLNAAMPAERLTGYLIKHELTHSIENTAQWDQLVQIVRSGMGEQAFTNAVNEVTQRYAANNETLTGRGAQREVVAQWVGQNLFQNGFAQAIVSGNASVGNAFVRTLDKLRLALGGTKNSRTASNIALVERLFMRALENSQVQNDTATEGGSYSISEIVDINGKSYGIGVHLDSTLLDNLTPEERIQMVKEYVKELGGSVFTAYDENDKAVEVTIAEKNARFKNKTGKKVPVNKDLTTKYIKNEVKQEAIALVDELITAAEYNRSSTSNYSHDWLDNQGENDWEYWSTYIQDKNNTIWKATLNIANSADGRKILYDIDPIKKVGQSVESDTIPTNTIKAQNSFGVNNYSMQFGEENSQYSFGDADEGGAITPPPSDAANSQALGNLGESTPTVTENVPGDNVSERVIDLSDDNELSQQLVGVHGSERYSIIQEYILNALSDQPITLSDGKLAVVDRRDASHIASRSGDGKTAQIAKIKELIETAKLYAEDPNVEHNKFDYFCYYKADVRYGNETFPLYLNVGRAKNDGQYHLYDITKNLRDTANRLNGFERPKPNEGYALGNGISTYSIRTSGEVVKENSSSKPIAQGRTLEELASELGDEELSRRMYMAMHAPSLPSTVEVDGQAVDALSYIDAVERDLPNDPEGLREFIRDAEQQLAAAAGQAYINGEQESITGLPINLQLFAARRRLDMMLDEGETGNTERRFYWQRTRGLDANKSHEAELIEYLAGRSETYNPVSNQKTLDAAKEYLRNPERATKLERRVLRFNPNDRFNEIEEAAVMVMINDARNDGDFDRFRDLTAALSRKGTDAGRAVQILAMQARMTPEGTLRAVERIYREATEAEYGGGFNEGIDLVGEKLVDVIERKQGKQSDSTDSVTAQEPGAAPDLSNATLPELETALGDKIAEEGNPYITEPQIREMIRRVVDDATNIPRQLKKMLTDDAIQKTLAEKIALIHQQGHLSDATMRHAMEEAMGLPTLNAEDVQHLIGLVETMQSKEAETVEWEAAQDDIYRFLAERLPTVRLEQLMSWRKFAMLFNPKTHFRNILSNWAMRFGINKMDSAVSSVLQNWFIKDPALRDAYVGWRGSEFGRQLMQGDTLQKQAERALVRMHRMSKYETTVGKLGQYKKIYGKSKVGEILNKANDWNSRLLELEDDKNFKPAFIDALGQIMTVRKATEITDEIFEIAYQKAAEVVFRKENPLAKVMTGLKSGMFDANTAKGKKALGYIADIVIPFTNTPANIAAASFAHSPLGIVKGAYDLIQMTRGKNNMQAAEVINTFAKGITGTALLLIGLLFGHLGWFNTGYGKTEKERAADELAGIQENSFLFGPVSISADWLQPAASPFIVGASIGQRFREDGLSLADLGGAIMDGTDSLFELTMLQSLYDVLGGYDAGASASAASIAENLVSQSIPTLLGQTARAIDPVQRKTRADNQFQTVINQIMAKVPGLTYLLEPEMDVWGDEVYRTGKASTGSAIVNALQQFGLPANVKIATGDDHLSRAVLELYNSGADKASRAIPTAVTRDDAKELGVDFDELYRAVASIQREKIEDLMSDQAVYTVLTEDEGGKKKMRKKSWSEMTEDERLRVMNRVYTDVKSSVSDPEEEYYDEIIRRMRNGN